MATLKYQQRLENLISQSPAFFKDFHTYLDQKNIHNNTQYFYIKDICSFLKYQTDIHPLLDGCEFMSLDIKILELFEPEDFHKYVSFLKNVRFKSDSTIRRNISALKVLYTYANTKKLVNRNTLSAISLPSASKVNTVSLDSGSVKKLLNGILANDRYLSDTESGKIPLSIPYDVKIKREPLVLRNHAIISLFISCGLKISQLVNIDVNDIDTENGYVVIHDSGHRPFKAYFGKDTAKSLSDYINGIPLPAELLDKYLFKNEECYNWCSEHIRDTSFSDDVVYAFPDKDDDFYDDMLALVSAMRRQGRKSLKPSPSEKALFLSSRGTRLSDRMIQVMIKEMVRTYLPDNMDKDIFSPGKLRTTCASMILKQTGDINLACAQLNQGAASMSKLCSALNKNNSAEQLRNMQINEW